MTVFFTRRHLLRMATPALATPMFFMRTIVHAKDTPDELMNGLVEGMRVVSDSLGLRPIGPSTGDDDLEIAGGGTVFARDVLAQSDMMKPGFPVIETSSRYTSNVLSDGKINTFVHAKEDRRNICLPMNVNSPSGDISGPYRGAKTLLEGPNLVGYGVMAHYLSNKGYSPEQVRKLTWPTEISETSRARERAILRFGKIHKLKGDDIPEAEQYLDRDVLHAELAKCVLRYSHSRGIPDGGGQCALIVNRNPELVLDFRFNSEMINV